MNILASTQVKYYVQQGPRLPGDPDDIPVILDTGLALSWSRFDNHFVSIVLDGPKSLWRFGPLSVQSYSQAFENISHHVRTLAIRLKPDRFNQFSRSPTGTTTDNMKPDGALRAISEM